MATARTSKTKAGAASVEHQGGTAPAAAATNKRKQSLAMILTEKTREAFLAAASGARFGQFYFYGLFTTEEGDYVVPTAWSEEALASVVARYCRDSAQEKDRLFSTSASRPPIPRTRSVRCRLRRPSIRPSLHSACFLALETLDREGLFGTGAAREKVM